MCRWIPVERLGVLLRNGSDQRNVSRLPGALEEHLKRFGD
jgi:hypothetical protein